MRFRVQIPRVEPTQYQPWPERCPVCGNPTFHSHGFVGKPLRDTRYDAVRPRRIQCTACGHTQRVYPAGVTARDQSERLRALSLLLWLLGVSYRGVEDVLTGLSADLKKSQIYDNVQQVGEKVRQVQEKRLAQRQVRVLAADCTHVRVQGQDTVVLQLSDGEHEFTLGVEVLAGEDTDSLQAAIGAVAQAVGAEVLLSDDADPYKTVADESELEHQLCQHHVVPNTLELLVEIAAQLEKRGAGALGEEATQIEQALADLLELEEIILWRSPGSQGRLEVLARRYEQEPMPKKGQRATPFARLKLLTMDLAADWSRLTLTERWRDGEQRRFLPPTNNVSEQRIGLNIKERYRTMRGYKSAVSLVRVATLTAYLHEEGDQALIRALAA
jgi:transposase-like protein